MYLNVVLSFLFFVFGNEKFEFQCKRPMVTMEQYGILRNELIPVKKVKHPSVSLAFVIIFSVDGVFSFICV
jgi:hypothetical protein